MNALVKEYHLWVLAELVSQLVLHQVLNADSDGVIENV